jgi:tetratricopeptide (TPR) repeat protein
MDIQSVLLELGVLEERGLVRVSGDGLTRLIRFKHALILEATYHSILGPRRAELHRDVAEVIQILFPQRDFEQTLTLAEHWLDAHEYQHALDELLPRAQDLVFTGHADGLAQLLERVQSDKIPSAQRLDLYIHLGNAYQRLGQYERARALYEQALTLTSGSVQESRALYNLGMIHSRLSEPQRALEYHRQGLSLAEKNGDIGEQARTSIGIGLAYWMLSDYARAEEFLLRGRELSVQCGDNVGLANAEIDLANVYRDRGDYTHAIAAAEHARDLYKASQLEILVANANLMIGTCYYSSGDLEAATKYYELAVRSSRELGDPHGILFGSGNLGELSQHLGRFDEAREYFKQTIDQSRKLKNDYVLAFALTGLAEVLLRQPEHCDDARTYAEEALTVAERMDSNERRGAAHRVLAEVLAAQRDGAAAEEHALQAVELLEHVGHALELKRAYATAGRIFGASAALSRRTLGATFLERAQKGA